MILLGAAYPRTELRRDSLDLYQAKLGHIQAEELKAAIHSWIERERFMPAISDLLMEWRHTRPERLTLVDRTVKEGTEEERRAHIEATKAVLKKLGGKTQMPRTGKGEI